MCGEGGGGGEEGKGGNGEIVLHTKLQILNTTSISENDSVNPAVCAVKTRKQKKAICLFFPSPLLGVLMHLFTLMNSS